MTDKFTICNMGLNGRFIKENGKIMEIERVVDLLNELSEENKKLKIFLKAVNEELDLANRDCDILEEENEELKQRNTELINKIDFLERVIDGDV